MSAGSRAYASQWLTGTIRHRRMAPVSHSFEYSTGMLALNLDEWHSLPRISRWFSLERFNWLSLRRADYFNPRTPDLKAAVCDQVHAATGWYPDGDIELITHPRYFGYVFNPVSFYFCYRPGTRPGAGAIPRVILAQITNTPWQERHLYCLECDAGEVSPTGWHNQRFSFDKRFHVSPFNPMDQDYQWLFSFRGPELRIHMNVRRQQSKVFDATLVVQRSPLTRNIMHQSLRRFPLESFKVVAGIYWHALKLKLKGAVFHQHPDALAGDDDNHALGHDDQGRLVDYNDQTTDSPKKGARVSSWRT